MQVYTCIYIIHKHIYLYMHIGIYILFVNLTCISKVQSGPEVKTPRHSLPLCSACFPHLQVLQPNDTLTEPDHRCPPARGLATLGDTQHSESECHLLPCLRPWVYNVSKSCDWISLAHYTQLHQTRAARTVHQSSGHVHGLSLRGGLVMGRIKAAFSVTALFSLSPTSFDGLTTLQNMILSRSEECRLKEHTAEAGAFVTRLLISTVVPSSDVKDKWISCL